MSARDHANVTVEMPRRALQLAADKLPAGVTVLMVPPDALPPEFVRLPDGGEDERCPVTGMSRTWVRERIEESAGTAHAIKVHHLRARGKTRGTVLIDRASLVAFIAAHPPPSWAAGKKGRGGDAETRRKGKS